MTLIGTAIDNKENLHSQAPQFMTPYGLVRFVIFDDAVSINDTERTSGLYILGKPRMGKSWLLISMILQDHKEDRGIFFVDPHGDAADQLLIHANAAGCPFTIYDFEDEERILTINPLIADPADPAARNNSFAKTKALFDKLWKNTFEEKPWLQLIMQNTIYTFIENQDYRLTELPMFFRDPAFRHFLVSNMQYNMHVKDYWLKTLASKDRRDQETQMEAAQTRCEIMFAHPAVRHFFGSKYHKSLEWLVNTEYAQFVKLSTRLPYEVKKIIGTAVINELVFGIQKRKPGGGLYCIYIDEFQNFVSFEHSEHRPLST